MQNLEVFFLSHFDTPRLSDERVRKFTEAHLRSMAITGLYPTLVTNTQTAYEAYFGAMKDEGTVTAVREGQTRAVELVVDAIKTQISRREGTVRGEFGEHSAEYQEFFPQGVTEYRQATLGNIEEKVDRFIVACEKYKTQLPGLKAVFTDLVDRFTAAREAQLLTKGTVAQDKVASATKRDVLELQLMINILTIALDHVGDPQGGLAFFDQSILNLPDKSGPATTPTV